MAIRSAWWMREAIAPALLPGVNNHKNPPVVSLEPHQQWPHQSPDGLAFKELERQLRENPGTHCSLEKLYYADDPVRRGTNFGPARKVECSAELKRVLLDQHRCASERLYVFIRVGTTPPAGRAHKTSSVAFFGLQIMEKYASGCIPTEAKRVNNSPKMTFRTMFGQSSQTWYVTRINVFFARVPRTRYDWNRAFEEAILALASKVEEELPGLEEHKLGLCSILTKVFYIINFTWGCFLDESEGHLNILVSELEPSQHVDLPCSLTLSGVEQNQKCVEEDLSSEDQLTYTRELHRLVPLFGESRRRISGAKDAIQQMQDHPFFTTVCAHKSMAAYLQKTTAALDEYNTRSLELSEQTNNLISLIFNIATLQDTRVAVEESRAANVLAASIRRVTVLTFIYLPLMLAASVFGMNVGEITGAESHHAIWSFVIVAAVLMLLTVGAWTLWSRLLNKKQKRRRLPENPNP
ncbi:MAG: hypothetical protein Q9200_004894 [Gallowayella weberi]